MKGASMLSFSVQKHISSKIKTNKKVKSTILKDGSLIESDILNQNKQTKGGN